MTIKNAINEHTQAITETLKLTPPIAIGGSSVAGVDWQTWVLILTLVYTILLILHKLFQIYKDVVTFKREEDAKASGEIP